MASVVLILFIKVIPFFSLRVVKSILLFMFYTAPTYPVYKSLKPHITVVHKITTYFSFTNLN